MINWLLENSIGILGIIVGGFIAYHVYFLSKKIDLRDKLVHRSAVRKQVYDLLYKISKGSRRKVELVNLKKYEKHYPDNNNLNRDGYTYLGAELKALRFDGIEFFCDMPRDAYKQSNGSLSFEKETEGQKEALKVLPVGIIPYEWIEYIDVEGDEFSYRPQFFTCFKGLKKDPYKRIIYYSESGTYQEGNDPIDMKYREIDIK